MAGKQLHREMTGRRRDEAVDESVKEEGEQTRFTKQLLGVHVALQLRNRTELSCNYFKQMRLFSR